LIRASAGSKNCEGVVRVLTRCFCETQEEPKHKEADEVIRNSCQGADDSPECHHDTLPRAQSA
jgi:hypothetical protein